MKQVTVKSVTSLGIKPVYDLVMPSNHNFILDNGAVVHNCSYSIVGYNTAYLKHKFPIEFWTAELTTFGDKEDKLRDYMQEIGHLILQPSISKSMPFDWTIEGNKIRAPLSVIKGLGGVTAQVIAKNAPYDSYMSFLEKNKSERSINRNIIIKLVDSGLLDEFGIPAVEMIRKYWSLKRVKGEIPTEVFNDDKVARFLARSALNMLCVDNLPDVVKDLLIARKWESVDRKSTPFCKQGTYMLANVQYAVRAMNQNYQDEVWLLAIVKSVDLREKVNKEKFLRMTLSDGMMDFEAVDWNCSIKPKIPENSLVLVKGRLKPGYKTLLTMYLNKLEIW
jgi:DNA polymerase III alpha subunit